MTDEIIPVQMDRQAQTRSNNNSLMLHRLALLIATFFITANALAIDYPVHDEFVTDVSGYLSSSAEKRLELELKNYEVKTGTEIAVVIIPLIPAGLSANEYATGLGNAWGVGKAGVDNGVIFLIETDDKPGSRDIYIAPGSQLEGGLTDIEAAAIVNEVVIPRFQDGDFDGGVIAGVTGIEAALAGEKFTNLRMNSGKNISVNWIQLIMFFVFLVVPWLGAILGRSEKTWPGGAIGGIAGLLGSALLGWTLFGIISGIVGLGLLGYGFDWLVSREFKKAKKSGKSPSWWAGGSGGLGGSSGSSFGGFGGGGFSGGGGGGRW